MNWKPRVTLSDTRHQHSGCSRLQNSRHVLDAKDVSTGLDQIIRQIQIIFCKRIKKKNKSNSNLNNKKCLKLTEIEFGPLRIRHVSGVGNGSLNDSTGLSSSVDSQLKIR